MNDTDFLKLEQKIDQLRSTQDKRDAFLELSMSKPDNNSPLSLKSQIVLEDILKRFPKELFCISISDYQDFRAHVKACFMDSFEGVFLIEHDLRWDQVLMSTDGFFAAKHRTSFGGTGYDLDLIQSLVNSTSLLSQCRSLDALHIMSDFVSSGRGKKMALPRSNLFRHIVDSLISLEASGADPYFELQSLELVSQDAFVFENMRDALLERLPAMLNHRSEKTLETTLRVYPGLTHHVEADNVQSMHQFATLVYRGAELSKLKASFKKILKTASPEDLRASRNLIDGAIETLDLSKTERDLVSLQVAVRTKDAKTLLSMNYQSLESGIASLINDGGISGNEAHDAVSQMRQYQKAYKKMSSLGTRLG